jgi:type II secretory pathway component PulC
MRQELVTAMAQAHEQARIDEVSATSVITVIDQPEPPVFPEPRGRLLRVLLGVIVGVIVGFGLALIQEFGERAKNERGEAYGKFQHVLKATKRDPFGLRPVDRPAPSSVESGE